MQGCKRAVLHGFADSSDGGRSRLLLHSSARQSACSLVLMQLLCPVTSVQRAVGLEEVYFFPLSEESVLSQMSPQERARVEAATPGSPAAVFTTAPLSS
jgi:hypothetical protein